MVLANFAVMLLIIVRLVLMQLPALFAFQIMFFCKTILANSAASPYLTVKLVRVLRYVRLVKLTTLSIVIMDALFVAHQFQTVSFVHLRLNVRRVRIIMLS
jgi:hypothetical protein